MLDALRHPAFELPDEFLRVVLHIVEHFLNRFAIENLVDVVMSVLHRDMRGIGVAKEIVHVAKDFLIGTHKEHTQIVVLRLLQLVDWQNVTDMARGHEVGNLAIRVASDVLQRGITGWPFVQTLYGYDGEQLVDGPRVGKALEQ